MKKYEYLVSFRFYGEKERSNAMQYFKGKRVAHSVEEAKKAIAYVKKHYPEVSEEDLQAVDFRIQRREIGEWEEVNL